MTLIQISDTHISAQGALLHGQVDTVGALELAIETILTTGAHVEALLLTGDLAHDGSPEAYSRLRALVEPAARKLDAGVVYAMGNHDGRTAFAATLLSSSDTDTVHWLGDLRVIVLDSTEPGRHEGSLTPAQLNWLRGELSHHAPGGTVLVLHHPPLPSPVPTVHLLRLRDVAALGDVLAGSDVGIILTGHAHHTGCGSLAGIPVWVSPALAYRVDALPPKARLRGVAGSGISRIDRIDGTFVATAIELGAVRSVYDEDEDEMVRQVRSVVG